jgi:hypothetical protein
MYKNGDLGRMVRQLFLIAGLLPLVFFSCKNEEKKITADMINYPQTASGVISQDLPSIEFDSTDIHFGVIAIGSKLIHEFRFTNTGKAPLLIGSVTPSCGCTTLKDWPKDPIMPGEGGSITVEFNSTGYPGQVSKTIQVATNCVPQDWYLKLIGEVVGRESIKLKKNPINMDRTR